MASEAKTSEFRSRRLRTQQSGEAAVFPSWIVSVVLHGTLLFLVATNLRTCGPGGSGGTEEFREVGIYVKSEKTPSDTESPAEDSAEPSSVPERSDETASVPETSQFDDAALNDLLELPSVDEAGLLGPGPEPSGPSTPGTGDAAELLQPSEGGLSVSAPAGGAGETSFFDIRDSGTRFVYVLDRSGSMSNHNAIRAAKAELTASLQALDATQQFQVIFYNNNIREMTDRRGEPAMHWATDINRTIARQFIDGVQPDGGTRHMPALRKALKFGPEVVYFLTDADEPQLSARELHSITQLNGGRARIHCIEFGKGPQLNDVDNFLKKLARQNGGSYRYRNVTRF